MQAVILTIFPVCLQSHDSNLLYATGQQSWMSRYVTADNKPVSGRLYSCA